MRRKPSTSRPQRLLNKQEARWEAQFKALKVYKRDHEDCLVPQNYPPEEPVEKPEKRRSLGRWCNWQRVEYWEWYNEGQDPEDPRCKRFVRLVELGFAWDLEDGKWVRWLKQLEEYKCEHKDPPPSGTQLGRWYRQQLACIAAKGCYLYRDPKTGAERLIEVSKSRRDLLAAAMVERSFEFPDKKVRRASRLKGCAEPPLPPPRPA